MVALMASHYMQLVSNDEGQMVSAISRLQLGLDLHIESPLCFFKTVQSISQPEAYNTSLLMTQVLEIGSLISPPKTTISLLGATVAL